MPKVSEAYLQARRNQILDAAWTCFWRKGYHETTMQDICKESGLSYGALYRYFSSKEDILRAASERAQSEALSRVAEARARSHAPGEALSSLGQSVFASVHEPRFAAVTKVHLETLPEVLRRPDLLESVRGELSTWRTSMSGLLSEARAAGQLSADTDPEGLAVFLMCVWEGLRVHNLIDPDHFRAEQILEVLRGFFAKDGALEAI